MLKRMVITSLAAAAFFSTATVVTAPFTPADPARIRTSKAPGVTRNAKLITYLR